MSTTSPRTATAEVRPDVRSVPDTGRLVLRLALALLAVQTAYRGWLCYRGWFVGDDFAFIGRARALPFWSRTYLLHDYNSHLMPGGFAVIRVLTDLWPMNFVPVATLDLAVQALTGFVVFRLLRELFRPRPGILVPLTVYLFSPMTLPAFVWWAAAINQLPLQLAMATALLMHVRYLRTGARWRGAAAVAAVVAGLLFSEKTLLLVPFVAAFTVLYFGAGNGVRRILRVAREHWWLWIAYGVVAFGYAGYYLAEVPSPTRGGASVGSTFTLSTELFGHAVLPGLFSGPWSWHPVGWNAAVADPPQAIVWLAALAAAGVVAASFALWIRASFGWFLALGYAAATLFLVANSRATVVGPSIGTEYRYSTDLALVVVLVLGLSFMPIAGDFARGEPQRLVPRTSTRETLAAYRAVLDVPPRPRGVALAAVVAVSFVYVVSSVASSNGYEKYWRPNYAKPYLANARHDLGKTGHSLSLADGQAPDRAVWHWVYPYNTLRSLVGRDTPRPSWFGPGDTTSNLYVLDTTGHARLAGVNGVAARPGPDGACGWRVDSSPTRIALTHKTFPWTWYVRIEYIASAAGTTTVHAGSLSTPIHVAAGLHAVYVMSTGAVDHITIDGLSAGALCTAKVQVGDAVPTPGTGP